MIYESSLNIFRYEVIDKIIDLLYFINKIKNDYNYIS